VPGNAISLLFFSFLHAIPFFLFSFFLQGCHTDVLPAQLGGDRAYLITVYCNASVLESNILSMMEEKNRRTCVNCECTQEVKAKLQYETIYNKWLPKFLYVRFLYSSLDNGQIPLTLDLTKRGCGKYRLLAGSVHGGWHYKAIIREGNDWRMYNDSEVRAVSETQALHDISAGKGLILIFERCVSDISSSPKTQNNKVKYIYEEWIILLIMF